MEIDINFHMMHHSPIFSLSFFLSRFHPIFFSSFLHPPPFAFFFFLTHFPPLFVSPYHQKSSAFFLPSSLTSFPLLLLFPTLPPYSPSLSISPLSLDSVSASASSPSSSITSHSTPLFLPSSFHSLSHSFASFPLWDIHEKPIWTSYGGKRGSHHPNTLNQNCLLNA